ncbi:STAS domain-containing protein [Nocardioides sp. 1609]|uniref:STAS domain-containing protein n=1 Tax=Nocardioides sp. 1609 TaxID=2508327 RepID=UPI001430A929|nr:STAS domain-containing protein [Nocardioides sp. 1609]
MIDVLHSSSDGRDDVLCIVTGSLDVVGAARARRTLDSLVAGGAVRVAVDLRGLTFVDASGLGVLARHWTGLASRLPGRVVLAGASEEFWTMVVRTQRQATFARPDPSVPGGGVVVPTDGVA